MLRGKLNKIYNLFSCCVPVKGHCRSIIYDLNRHHIHFIPNSLYFIIRNNKNKTLFKILTKFNKSERRILLEYFNFLEERELIFPLEEYEMKRFPKLPLSWDFPSSCSNAIIDIGIRSKYDFYNLINQLNDLYCFHLQIRFFDFLEISEIVKILEYINSLSFSAIQLVIDYKIYNNERPYIDLMERYWKLSKIEVFNAPEKKIVPVVEFVSMVIFYTKDFKDKNQCGNIDQKYFSIEMNHFTEAQHFNTCLNRKICIDENGEVKNCPSMTKSFGHIDDVNLKKIITNFEFTKIWSIRKDDIDVCKDCEFRYICTDCRCYIKSPENIYSQPARCGYNPYIAKWENEQGYITIEKWREENSKWEKGIKRYPLIKNPQKVNEE